MRGAMGSSFNPNCEDISLFKKSFNKKELGFKSKQASTCDLDIDIPAVF